MLSLIAGLPPYLELLVLIGAAVGAFLVLRKTIYNPIKGFLDEVSAGMRSLNGYDEVTDPGTGTVLKEATPALAKRVEAVENAVLLLTDIQAKHMELEQKFLDHISWSEGWVAAIEAHRTTQDARLEALEARITDVQPGP